MGKRGWRSGWTPYEDELLARLWLTSTLEQIARRLRRARETIRGRARELELPPRANPRRVWTEDEIELLRQRYPHERTDRIAADMGFREGQVYQKARALGLNKTAAFRASPESGCITKGDPRGVGAKYRFKPGQTPPNKGLRRPGWAPGRMAETQFKKGHLPRTWKPVGTYRVNAGGYLDRKISDTGYPPRDWEPVHRLLWAEAHGPIPEGHVVAFRPGMRTTVLEEITLDRLELLTKAEVMRRNNIHNYPPELRDAMRLIGKVKRKIREREENDQ